MPPLFPTLDTLATPALLLDEARMMRNIERLAGHARALGVTLRPHLKTAKSLEIACRLGGPITVSTLAEAEAFHAAGHADILYAVGIAPQKLPRVQALRAAGCDLVVILDSLGQARAVTEAGVPALIEIDSDGHRGGLLPDDPALLEVAAVLNGAGLLRGVLTHAGESYGVRGRDAHAAFAERERAATLARRNRRGDRHA
ncbi:alanine racemase, partial [Yangia mangrovi]